MADEIVLRISGDPEGIQQAAEAARTAIKGVGAEVETLNQKAPSDTLVTGFEKAAERAKIYEAELKTVGQAALDAAVREAQLGLSLKESAQQFGVQETSLRRHIALTREAADAALKAAAERTRAERESADAAKRLTREAADAAVKAAAERTRAEKEAADAAKKSADQQEASQRALKVAAVGALAAIGTAATAAGLEYQNATSTIAKSTGATGAELNALKDDLKAVMREVPASAAVGAEVLSEYNKRLGLTGDALRNVTKMTLDYADVNRVDATESARLLSRVMNGLEIEASELPGLLDKLTFASQKSGIGVNDLAAAILNGGQNFVSLGFSIDRSIALFSQFERVGANVNDVTTSLSQVITKLAKEGFTDANKAFDELLRRIKEAPDRLTAINIAVDAFGAKVGAKLTEEIRGGTFEVEEFVKELEKAPGTLSRTAEASSTAADTLGTLKNRASAVLEPVGSLITGVGQLGFAASGIMGLSSLGGLPPLLSKLIPGFFGVGAATTTAAAGTTTLTTATNGLSAAFLAMPFAGVLAGVGAIGLAIAALRQRYNDLADDVAKGMRQKIAGGGEAGRSEVTAELAKKEQELTRAVQEGNRALAARLQAEVTAIREDTTRLAILDTINKAISLGADKNITYAKAIEFITEKERARLGIFQESVPAAAAQQTAQDRVREGMRLTAEETAKYNKALKEIGATAFREAARQVELGKSMEDAAKRYGIEQAHLERFIKLRAESATATKAATKALSDAEKAEQKHIETLAKQADALEKLGVVTENKVLQAMGEFGTLVKLATDAGVPFDVVLRALSPRLEELKEKARASGVEVEQFGQLIDEAAEAARRLNAADISKIIRDLPAIQTGLTVLPGTALDLNKVMNVGAIQAGNLTDSYKFFGLSTRAELEATARAAVAHYNEILASGTATPEAIAKAFEEMQVKVAASTGEVASVWGETMRGWIDSIPGLLQQALTGGGGMGGFGKALASMIGADVGKNLFSEGGALGSLSKTVAGGASKLFGKTFGDALGLAMPGIGAALGALAGPMLDKVFGLFRDKQHEQVNDLRDEFLKRFGASGTGIGSGFQTLATQLHAAGPAGDALFQRLLNAKKVDEFNAAMKAVNETLANIPATMADQATSAGFQTQAQLKAIANDAVALWKYMRDSGLYSAEAIEDAWERANTALIKAGDQTTIAADKAKQAIGELQKELDGLYVSVADEAEEEEMGVEETRARARIAQIEEEIEAKKAAIEEEKRAREEAAQVAQDATDEATRNTGESIDTLGSQLLDQKKHWDDWASHAIKRAREVQYEVDAISFGHSPGGLKEIPLQLATASKAARDFERDTVRRFRNLGHTIDHTSLSPKLDLPTLPDLSARPAYSASSEHLAGSRTAGVGQPTVVLEAGAIVIDRPILKDRESMDELSLAIAQRLKGVLSPRGAW